jgi:eukaryotic-like serine/threonine-protein kinase
MQNAEWIKIKEVFNQTLDLPFGERESFLQNYDDFVQREVRNLIESDEQADEFIERPAAVEFGISQDLNIGQVIDEYKVIGLIGEGGMGNVYLAENTKFAQKVALKLIKRGMDTRAVLKRFKLERQILSRLNHPNIAKLLGGGETTDGLPYFAMEYIEGETITKFCEHHDFDINERLELFQKVCDAVSYAHQNLIIHRDLKPSNIIVTDDGTPKLLDFGIAKLLNDENDKTLTIGRMFTPEYASPEQINGLPITTATDVYSLGVVLYELLSGVRPFNCKSKSYGEIANLILTQEPQKPSAVVSGQWSVVRNTSEIKDKTQSEQIRNPQSAIRNLKGDLDNIILKALSKEPDSRYQTINDFSADILRHLQGLPVTATLDSKRYRFSKFVRRNTKSVTISAVVSLLILSLSGVAIYQGIVATREREKAQRSYSELQKIANDLMTETNIALQEVHGSVKIRRNLVEKSIVMLDRIALDNPTDEKILDNLANGYLNLGQKQNYNFREFRNAIESHKKGVRIRRKLLEANPNSTEAKLKLVNSLAFLGEVYFGFGDKENLFENLDEQEKIHRELYANEPQNLDILNGLNSFLSGRAEIARNFQQESERQKYLNESLNLTDESIRRYEAKELNAAEMKEFAYAVSNKANILKDLGNIDEALIYHDKSFEIAKKSFDADVNQNIAFNLTVRSNRFKADIFRERKQFDKALEMYQISLDRLDLGVQKMPHEANGLNAGINIYQIRKALMLEKIGKHTEAKKLLETAYGKYLAEVDKNKDDSANVIYYYEALPDVAEYYVDANQLPKAIEVWENHIKRIQYFLDKNPEDGGFVNYMADAYKKIGDTYSSYDETSKSYKINDKARLAKARVYYQRAAEMYRKTMTLYTPTKAEKDNLAKIEEKINLTAKTVPAN